MPCLVFGMRHLFPLSILGGEASHELALTFERDVRPIFKAMCFHCHGEDDTGKGGWI